MEVVATNIIVRVWGIPHSLAPLAKYLGLFDEIVQTGNVGQGLRRLSEQYGWMNYEADESTRFIEDPDPQRPGMNGGTPASPTWSAMQELFRYVEDPSKSWDLSPTSSRLYEAMPAMLTLFQAHDNICTHFHTFFPYFKGEFAGTDPAEVSLFVDGRRVTHWELLLNARQKEGRFCRLCHCLNTWEATPNTAATEDTCTCTFYRTDLLTRTTRNPYFDEDNRWQRERDLEDEHRRQMQD